MQEYKGLAISTQLRTTLEDNSTPKLPVRPAESLIDLASQIEFLCLIMFLFLSTVIEPYETL